jgi:phage-related protein
MKWEIIYYNEKLRVWIDQMPVGIRASYARITERRIRYGPNLKMPFTKSLGDGLFELRAKGKEGIGRVFYCTMVKNKIVMLHGFIKKTQKIPKKELNIAKKRMKEVKKNESI